MSSRRSRPPRGRKSRNPEASANDVPVIIPPTARVVDMTDVANAADPPRDELAALEAGWDELLLA